MTPSPIRHPIARGAPHRLAPGRRRLFTSVGALAIAAVLAACGGGSGSEGPAPAPLADGALAASAPGELLAYVKGRLAARDVERRNGTLVVETFAGGPAWLDTVTTTAGTAGRSQTMVQEEGVDEDDLIKSDGTVVYTLGPRPTSAPGQTFATLQLHRAAAAPGTPPLEKRIDLAGTAEMVPYTRGMYLAAEQHRVAVLSESSGFAVDFPDCPTGACASLLPFPGSWKSQVLLHLVDVATPAGAAVRDQLTIDGRLVGSRQVGRMLYLVTAYTPTFEFERQPVGREADRQAALDRLQPADFLPRVAVNAAAPQPLVTETECHVQPKNASLELTVTTITAIDLASPTLARTNRCFVGGTEALYMAPSSLYLATTRHEVEIQQGVTRFAPGARTDIHKFAVEGPLVTYRGTGSVQGHLGWDREKSSYRLSEHDGLLRVLSFTGQTGWMTVADAARGTTAPSPATLTILRERTAERTLEVLSTLPNAQRPAPIGEPGEQLYGVRFFGDRAYAVTFRQVDPLYVIDLSNPADPRVAGELKIPGFSDYLFPLDGGLLLGVGKDADDQGRVAGVKVALFDVGDPARPRQLASRLLGGRGSYSGLDTSRHALNLRVVDQVARVALPVVLNDESGSAPRHGLQRLEVDTAAGTIAAKPLIAGAAGSMGWVDLSTDRSLQIGSILHYLSQGTLSAYAW